MIFSADWKVLLTISLKNITLAKYYSLCRKFYFIYIFFFFFFFFFDEYYQFCFLSLITEMWNKFDIRKQVLELFHIFHKVAQWKHTSFYFDNKNLVVRCSSCFCLFLCLFLMLLLFCITEIFMYVLHFFNN